MRTFLKQTATLLFLGLLTGCCPVWAQKSAVPAGSMVPSPVPASLPTKTSAPAASPLTNPSPAAVSASAKAAAAIAPLPDPGSNQTYTVGVEDELQISVWKEPELSGPVVVRPDGKITLPLLNDIVVVGLTTKQLQDMLTEKLKPFVTEPQVTIIVRNIRSRKVYLVGQIARAGAFPLNGNKTVLQMIAEAGGVGPFAKADHIYVLRTTGDRQERLNFNYRRALKGADPKADFPLVAGDVIVVP